jgi:hypothetical protein
MSQEVFESYPIRPEVRTSYTGTNTHRNSASRAEGQRQKFCPRIGGLVKQEIHLTVGIPAQNGAEFMKSVRPVFYNIVINSVLCCRTNINRNEREIHLESAEDFLFITNIFTL